MDMTQEAAEHSGGEKQQGGEPAQGALQSRNVRIHDRRTSVRLEPEMWSALNEVARLENSSIHEICSAVHDLKEINASFTAALRVFLMEYYRNASRTSVRVSDVQKLLRDGKK
jgi:predicted DNA-binding ribbon-helix-helix protein